jgi:transcriptional regulator with XRE-family HTH domain
MPMKKVDAKYNTSLIKIGLNVAYYRKLKSITQEKLAEKVNVSRNTIANIENSDKFHSMALGTLFKIAVALDIPIKKLFDFRDEDN